MSAAASIQSQLHEVSKNGADVHITVEPMVPEPGIILDSHGDKVTPKKSLMVRADEKATQKIELSRGTLLLVSVGPTVLLLILSYGGTLWNKSADDSAVKTRLEAVETAIKQYNSDGRNDREKINDTLDKLNTKFDTIKDKLNEQAVKDAERKGQLQGFSLRKESE